VIIGYTGIDPSRPGGRLFHLPEWCARLQPIHDEFTGGKGFTSMG
jgi:hypothetical protein